LLKKHERKALKEGGEKIARERGPQIYREINRKSGEKVVKSVVPNSIGEIGRNG